MTPPRQAEPDDQRERDRRRASPVHSDYQMMQSLHRMRFALYLIAFVGVLLVVALAVGLVAAILWLIAL